MDLWRLWIRRMHSFWQVLREEGLATPAPGQTQPRAPHSVTGGTLILMLVLAVTISQRRSAHETPPPAAG